MWCFKQITQKPPQTRKRGLLSCFRSRGKALSQINPWSLREILHRQKYHDIFMNHDVVIGNLATKRSPCDHQKKTCTWYKYCSILMTWFLRGIFSLSKADSSSFTSSDLPCDQRSDQITFSTKVGCFFPKGGRSKRQGVWHCFLYPDDGHRRICWCHAYRLFPVSWSFVVKKHKTIRVWRRGRGPWLDVRLVLVGRTRWSSSYLHPRSANIIMRSARKRY